MGNPYKHLKEYEGTIFKYHDLCDLLGLEFKRGKGKELQLKQLRQFLDLDQQTIPRKIILKEIYEDDKITIVAGKGKYLPFIRNILLNQLHSASPYIGTYKELIPILGLASNGYAEARYNAHFFGEEIKKKYAGIIDTDYLAEENLYNFLFMTGTILQDIIRSSLNQLEKKKLISVKRSLRLFRYTRIDVDGMQKKIVEHHDLSPAEYSLYIKIGTDLIEEFQLSSRQQLFYRTPSKKTSVNVHELYKDRLNEFTKNLGYDFSGTLFIIFPTQEGHNYDIEPAYLDRSLLAQTISNRINQETDLRKIIPQPILEKFIAIYFSSPSSSI